MEAHEEFEQWAVERGVKIKGVKAHKFEGRGLGIVATKRHEAKITLLSVPHSALLTKHTVPKSITSALPKATVHNLLATQLSLTTTSISPLSPWMSVLPSYASFEESMPLLYPASLQALLPSAAQGLLTNQKAKLAADWTLTSKAYPEISYQQYLYNWLLVNTRTFYYLSPSHRGPPPARDDCMALNPFADYFNHSSAPTCAVEFTSSTYTVTTVRKIEEGEEVYISYGNHSNDFLLAEYGFVLESNERDEISLDPWLTPLFSISQKERLEESGFWGKYILDANEVCYRTQIALRILSRNPRQWDRCVRSGLDDAERDQEAVDKILMDVLKKTNVDAVKTLGKIKKVKDGTPSQRETLTKRWRQIEKMLEDAMERIES